MILNEKGILQQFDLVIYPIQLVIAIGDLEKEINRFYKPYNGQYNYIAPPKDTKAVATTYHVKNKKTNDSACLIWIPKTEEVRGSYLCHESGHVTLEIFQYIGAHVGYDDQEPFCYLLGAIFRLCNSAFYHWKNFMDKKKARDTNAFRIDLNSFLQDVKNEFNSEKEVDYFLDKWTPKLLESASETIKNKHKT